MDWLNQVLVTMCTYQNAEAVLILLALLGALGMRLKQGSKRPLWLLKRGLNSVPH